MKPSKMKKGCLHETSSGEPIAVTECPYGWSCPHLEKPHLNPEIDTDIISCCYISDGSTETEFIGTEDEVTNAVCEFINKSNHKDDIGMTWHEGEDCQGDIVMECETFKTICDDVDVYDTRFVPDYISDENANKILSAFGVESGSREFRGDSIHKDEYDSSLVQSVLDGFIYEDSMYESLTEDTYNEWPDVDIDGNVINNSKDAKTGCVICGYVYNYPDPCYLTKEGYDLTNDLDGNDRFSEKLTDAYLFRDLSEAQDWVDRFDPHGYNDVWVEELADL